MCLTFENLKPGIYWRSRNGRIWTPSLCGKININPTVSFAVSLELLSQLNDHIRPPQDASMRRERWIHLSPKSLCIWHLFVSWNSLVRLGYQLKLSEDVNSWAACENTCAHYRPGLGSANKCATRLAARQLICVRNLHKCLNSLTLLLMFIRFSTIAVRCPTF